MTTCVEDRRGSPDRHFHELVPGSSSCSSQEVPGCPTDTEWGLTPTGTQGRLAGAPPGTVLALPAAAGSSVLYVADDELWLADTSSLAPAVMAAGPLYSSVAPNGYYGEVDWSASFSWSLAPVARQVSAQLIGEVLAPSGTVIP